jgi:hypothetical protein
LTRGQLAVAGLDRAGAADALADALAEHDVLCAWRRSPGGTVYVHLLPRNDEDGR